MDPDDPLSGFGFVGSEAQGTFFQGLLEQDSCSEGSSPRSLHHIRSDPEDDFQDLGKDSENAADGVFDAEERKRREQIRQAVLKELQQCREDLRVDITSVTEVGEGRKRYVSYTVVCEDTTVPRTTLVQRRFSDFVWLHKVLSLDPTLQCLLIPNLPPKQILGRFDEDFVQRRRRGLIWFLQRLVEIHLVAHHKEFRLFLTATDWTWRETQTDRDRLLTSLSTGAGPPGSGGSSPSGSPQESPRSPASAAAAQPRRVSKFAAFKQKLWNVTGSLTGQKKIPPETTPLDEELVRVATYARQFHTLTQIIDGTLGSMVEDMDRESDVWFQLLERIEQQRLSAVSSSSSSLDSAYSSPGPPGKPLVSSSSVSTSISGLPATGHSRSTSGRLVRRSASGLSLSASSAQRSSYTSFSQIISAGGGVAGGDENIFHTGAASPSSLTSSVVDNPQPSENLQASSNISDSQKHVGNSLLAAFETPSNPGHSNDKQTSHAHRRDAWLVEEEHPLELFAEGMALILPELLTDQANTIQRAAREEFSHYSQLAVALQSRVIQPRAELLLQVQEAKAAMERARDRLQHFQLVHPKVGRGSAGAQESHAREYQKLAERQTATDERYRALQTRLRLINDRCVRQIQLMHCHKHERLREAVAQMGRSGLAAEHRLQLQLASLRSQIEKIADPFELEPPELGTRFGSTTVMPFRGVRSGRLNSEGGLQPGARSMGGCRTSSRLYSQTSVISEDGGTGDDREEDEDSDTDEEEGMEHGNGLSSPAFSGSPPLRPRITAPGIDSSFRSDDDLVDVDEGEDDLP